MKLTVNQVHSDYKITFGYRHIVRASTLEIWDWPLKFELRLVNENNADKSAFAKVRGRVFQPFGGNAEFKSSFCRWLETGRFAEVRSRRKCVASGRKITNGKQNYRVLPRRYLEAIGAVGANLRPFPSTDPSVASLETPEKPVTLQKKKKNGNRSAHGPHRRDVAHSVSKVSCFLLETCHYRRLQNEKR